MKGLTVGTGFCHFVIVIRVLSVRLDLYISGTCPSLSPSPPDPEAQSPHQTFDFSEEIRLTAVKDIESQPQLVEQNMLEFYLDEII